MLEGRMLKKIIQEMGTIRQYITVKCQRLELPENIIETILDYIQEADQPKLAPRLGHK
jgi:hypothetical protein